MVHPSGMSTVRGALSTGRGLASWVAERHHSHTSADNAASAKLQLGGSFLLQAPLEGCGLLLLQPGITQLCNASAATPPSSHSLPVGLSPPVYLLAPKPAPLHLQDSAKPLCNCETGQFFTKQTFGTLYYVPLCRAQVNTANQHLG